MVAVHEAVAGFAAVMGWLDRRPPHTDQSTQQNAAPERVYLLANGSGVGAACSILVKAPVDQEAEGWHHVEAVGCQRGPHPLQQSSCAAGAELCVTRCTR